MAGVAGLLIRGGVDAVLVGLHWFVTNLYAIMSVDVEVSRSGKASGELVGCGVALITVI